MGLTQALPQAATATQQKHSQARAAVVAEQETQMGQPTGLMEAMAAAMALEAAVVEQRPMERPQATAAMARLASSLSRLISNL
jgi:cobalamin biosynthesis protein CbiD